MKRKISIDDKQILASLKKIENYRQNPDGNKWDGCNQIFINEIQKIPRRLVVRRIVLTAVIICCVLLGVAGGIYIWQQYGVRLDSGTTSVKRPLLNWSGNNGNWEILFPTQTETNVSSGDGIPETLMTVERRIVDIESQLNWIAQPVWNAP